MKIKLDDGAIMPTRAHETDAGLDLYATEDRVIFTGNGVVFDTGVHIEFPHGYYGKIESKSGLNVKRSVVAEGVIDAGYTGPIVVKLYNHGDEPQLIRAGEKLTQLVVLPVALPELELVDSLEETERGEGGFGSTGR